MRRGSVIMVAAIVVLALLAQKRLGETAHLRDYRSSAALRRIQTLNTAEVQYNSTFGRFAQSLDELGPSAADLISAELAQGEAQGFRFTLIGSGDGYSITAVPVIAGAAGSRTFYSDQSL